MVIKHRLLTKNNLIVAVMILLILVILAKIWGLNFKINRLTSKIETLETTKIPLSSTPEFIKPPERTKEEKYEVLKKLAVEVQANYFANFLGSPTYINFAGKDKSYKEYIYVDDDFYVQAITDSDDKVLSYAITSRKKDFNPTFGMGGLFKVSLNKTPFSEWRIDEFRELPLSCYYFIGAHDPLYYFEKDFFGNPGNYLTFLVGMNNSASFEDLPDTSDTDDLMTWGPIDCEKINKEDRKRMAPNTFIVRNTLSVDIKEEDLSKDGPDIWFGPNNIQTRTLNE